MARRSILPRPMIKDAVSREQIAASFRAIIDEVCAEHVGTLTQEPALTARIGQAIESRLNGYEFGEYTLKVITQDIPDRGPSSLESAIGADLYVNIEVQSSGAKKSKGFLVQAKMEGGISRKLRTQCENMLSRSRSAYVWTYKKDGVRVAPATRAVETPKRLRWHGTNAYDLFSEVLACREGDPDLAVPSSPNPREALRRFLNELDIRSGIAVKIEEA